MPFISVADEVANKSFTCVENKFITKYLPVLDPMSIKVYLYSLYLCQRGQVSYTLSDLAKSLGLTEEQTINYFEYLDEFELVSILSVSPFEVKILDAENVYGTPKKFKPEKYSDFTKNVQNIIKGRMISTNEFREYFVLLEEYGFEQNALIMIINYCVNLKGDNIRIQYIKKVAKSFADEGVTTAKKVDEKLSAYTSSTPALIRIFTVAGIKKQPDIDDDKLFKKWTEQMGFDENSVISAAKSFKVKTVEKLDSALDELYKNKKFDVKEIADYCANKNSIFNLTLDIAKNLGVYMQYPATYVENYVNGWCNYGYSFECLISLAAYCFKNDKKSFEDMNAFILSLYGEGLVDDLSVLKYIEKLKTDNELIRKILSYCGLTRKIIGRDEESLARWRNWNFTDEMILEAAKLSSGKSNPFAYMNAILSSWKNDGINTLDKISSPIRPDNRTAESGISRTDIERHYFDLRHSAEERADTALRKATEDKIYGKIHKELKELSIKLAFAEIRDKDLAEEISKQYAELENKGDKRLKELGIDKADFTPRYRCEKCKDTGYDKFGAPCECMKKLIAGN